MGALALRPADLRYFDGEARVQDLRLGEVLGFDHPINIRRLIRGHLAKLERHGAIFSAAEKFLGQKRGPASQVYYLNERQAYRLCMFSDAPNAERVQEQMVEVFLAYRRGQLAPAAPAGKARTGRGRGRLSSIDLLPPHCADDVAWVNAQLRARKMPQTEILREFNDRLADRGMGGISKGAFGRHSVRQAVELHRLEANKLINDEVIALFGSGGHSAALIATAEVLRERLSHAASQPADVGGGQIGAAALALQRLSNVIDRASQGQI